MNVFNGNASSDIRWYGIGGPSGLQGNVNGDDRLIWACSNRLLNSHSFQMPPSELRPFDPMFTYMNLNMRNIPIYIFRSTISCYLVGENCSFVSIPSTCVSHGHKDRTVITLVIVEIWTGSVRFFDALSNVLYRLFQWWVWELRSTQRFSQLPCAFHLVLQCSWSSSTAWGSHQQYLSTAMELMEN